MDGTTVLERQELGCLGYIAFYKGITDNVLEDKGLQPKEYTDKKVLGISIANFTYLLGFLSVPVLLT